MAKGTRSQASGKTYILVHGAGHGSWCWKKVIPLLEKEGYHVITPDLPGIGDDTAKLAGISLEDDIRAIINAANGIAGKVSLLGHSSGGVLISQAAESLGSDKVDKLIYLDAILPQNGESVFSLADKAIEVNKKTPPRHPDDTSRERFIFIDNQKVFRWNPEFVQRLFYHDCSADDISFAIAHLRWESVATIVTPVHVTEAKYGKIKKYYILCTDSRDLDKTAIASNVHCEKVYQLPSSHSPFFSMPEKLVSILVKLK